MVVSMVFTNILVFLLVCLALSHAFDLSISHVFEPNTLELYFVRCFIV